VLLALLRRASDGSDDVNEDGAMSDVAMTERWWWGRMLTPIYFV